PQRHLPPRAPHGLAPRRGRRYDVPGRPAGGVVNPLSVVPLLVYTLAATLWPAQVDSRRRGASLLLVEAVIVAAAVVAGGYLAELVVPRSQGLWWGRVGLLATGY